MNSERYCHGLTLVTKYVAEAFPEVSRQLGSWTVSAGRCPDAVLKEQALASISQKKFHAQGGSVYAFYPGADLKSSLKFIISLQTISDYLDNLCDRTEIRDEASFRQLHLSMLDAVDLCRDINSYYHYYPYKDDGGYLESLVDAARQETKKPPSYHFVVEIIKKYVQLYSDLQTYKHLSHHIREDCLKTWANYYKDRYPDISCWEFSAAAGSTLGMFVLFSAAFDPYLTIQETKEIEAAYFPWVCGLHILLDYYIDSQEDSLMGDLNFTQYYKNLKECEDRLCFFVKRSRECCSRLRYPGFHNTVIKGLLAMYLSDPKAKCGLNRLASRNILKRSEKSTRTYYNMCRILRTAGVL